ncbi:hypothetical protein BC936DRAFT_148251 [Jimgerdemannia flammicorona]|uniref:Uncharacterized protein n=1 Tax=Jimgerdemannia flammicorona TaxID=994334 RepID=A0A433D3E5_9FUNG|nr:hypothetical protein BC936DRAFT_148251 [Jimgerdemannia flammicorona]
MRGRYDGMNGYQPHHVGCVVERCLNGRCGGTLVQATGPNSSKWQMPTSHLFALDMYPPIYTVFFRRTLIPAMTRAAETFAVLAVLSALYMASWFAYIPLPKTVVEDILPVVSGIGWAG